MPKRRFNKKLDSLLDFFQSSLKDNKLKKKYYLFGVNTSIALGLSGNIGVLAWGGRTTLQLFWHRREVKNEKTNNVIENKTIENNDNEPGIYSLRYFKKNRKQIMQDKRLTNSEVMLIENYIEKKKVEATKLMFAIEDVELPNWEIFRLRFDINFGADVTLPYALLVKLGADFRIRFELYLEKKVANSSKSKSQSLDEKSLLAKNIQQTLTVFTKQLDVIKSEEENLREKGLKFRHAFFGIAAGAGASVGVLKGSASLAAFIFVKLKKSTMPYSDVSDELPIHIPREGNEVKRIVKDYNIKSVRHKGFKTFLVPTHRLKKGIKKSISFAKKVGTSIKKRSLKKKKWAVKTIKSRYEISLSGDVGVLSISGTPTLELEFLNLNF